MWRHCVLSICKHSEILKGHWITAGLHILMAPGFWINMATHSKYLGSGISFHHGCVSVNEKNSSPTEANSNFGIVNLGR